MHALSSCLSFITAPCSEIYRILYPIKPKKASFDEISKENAAFFAEHPITTLHDDAQNVATDCLRDLFKSKTEVLTKGEVDIRFRVCSNLPMPILSFGSFNYRGGGIIICTKKMTNEMRITNKTIPEHLFRIAVAVSSLSGNSYEDQFNVINESAYAGAIAYAVSRIAISLLFAWQPQFFSFFDDRQFYVAAHAVSCYATRWFKSFWSSKKERESENDAIRMAGRLHPVVAYAGIDVLTQEMNEAASSSKKACLLERIAILQNILRHVHKVHVA